VCACVRVCVCVCVCVCLRTHHNPLTISGGMGGSVQLLVQNLTFVFGPMQGQGSNNKAKR
jgi:hypothetical protein